MNWTQFWKAVFVRCSADSTLTGLATGGIYWHSEATEGGYPYVVVDVGDFEQADAFTRDVVRLVFRFHVFHKRDGGTIAASNAQKCSSIIARIYGNAAPATQTAPTYGFHRHQLDLSSGGWTGGFVRHINSAEAHELDTLHFIEEFEVWISKA